jgi:hypothetical protein
MAEPRSTSRRAGPVAMALFASCIFSIFQQLSVVPQSRITPDTIGEAGGPEHERVQPANSVSSLPENETPQLPVESFDISASKLDQQTSTSTFPEKEMSQPLEAIVSRGNQPGTNKNKFPPARASLEFPWSPLLDSWEPPKWITDYMDWHAHIRSIHPAFNATASTNETLPALLIVYCSGSCGGLHDRLGSLPFDLYLANQTKRLLLYVWESPAALEHFLVPSRLNWRLEGLPRDHPQLVNLRKAPSLFDLYKRGDKGTDEILWNETLPNAIGLALNHTIPVFTTPLRTHNGEFFLEAILKGLGETDMIHTTPTFGWIWQAIFQPSPRLHTYIEQMRQSMNLTKGHYTAVHCRLHYPTMLEEQAKGVPLQSLHGSGALDRAGLLLEGPGKEFAVAVGIHAVQCARTLAENDDEPLYFFSDANNLVEYLAQRNHSETHNRTDEFDVDQSADQVLSQVQLVARPDIHERNHHLDHHHSSKPRDYYSIFADLYLAMEARCITFGYGGFGRFAQQLTNNTCYLQHQLHIHVPFFGHSLNMYGNVCTKETYTNLTQER